MTAPRPGTICITCGCCPNCGQPLRNVRLGVRMSDVKCRIFDLVQRAGCDGIATADINDIVYGGRATGVLIRNHIHQINELMVGTEVKVTSVGYAYVLAKRPAVVQFRRKGNGAMAIAK